MKVKTLLIAPITALLVACGGHDFEGKYETKVAESVGAMGIKMPKQTLIIGEDFMEANGQRQTFDEVFVRDLGGTDYLIFKNGDQEMGLKVIDDDTLAMGTGITSVKYARVQ